MRARSRSLSKTVSGSGFPVAKGLQSLGGRGLAGSLIWSGGSGRQHDRRAGVTFAIREQHCSIPVFMLLWEVQHNSQFCLGRRSTSLGVHATTDPMPVGAPLSRWSGASSSPELPREPLLRARERHAQPRSRARLTSARGNREPRPGRRAPAAGARGRPSPARPARAEDQKARARAPPPLRQQRAPQPASPARRATVARRPGRYPDGLRSPSHSKPAPPAGVTVSRSSIRRSSASR
jgi:hypothetical protein